MLTGCASSTPRNFGEDVAFLRKHTDVVVLGKDEKGPRVAVAPAYQGRVMTSTAAGDKGFSYGWINYDLIKSGEVRKHINPLGGEERFWLGPEGGQFAIFFKKGDKFDLEAWQTPPIIDTAAYRVTSRGERSVAFEQNATLENYSGTRFDLRIERTVRLLDAHRVEECLGLDPGPVKMVAYESENTITNIGATAWSKSGGLLSIWILCMYKHSPASTVVVPIRRGSDADLGPAVNDAYFGKVPPERLVVREGVLFFKADGQYRSKIGVSPRRATPLCGSYDAQRKVLTLVQFNQPKDAVDYVNSMWEIQQDPYAGDVVNSYNDGPPAPGKPPLGPFYELETSSPAVELVPRQSLTHIHRTFHFEGPQPDLDALARATLGVTLDEIAGAFGPGKLQ